LSSAVPLARKLSSRLYHTCWPVASRSARLTGPARERAILLGIEAMHDLLPLVQEWSANQVRVFGHQPDRLLAGWGMALHVPFAGPPPRPCRPSPGVSSPWPRSTY